MNYPAAELRGIKMNFYLINPDAEHRGILLSKKLKSNHENTKNGKHEIKFTFAVLMVSCFCDKKFFSVFQPRQALIFQSPNRSKACTKMLFYALKQRIGLHKGRKTGRRDQQQ